jgi:hypothetical protein
VFLIRSMTKRLRRLPASFDPPPGSADGTPARDAVADGDGHTTDVEASPDR